MAKSKKFKANDHEDTTPDFSPFPAGEQTLALVKAERKESSTAGNYYQNCQMKVIGGDHKGRVIFHMFHLENSEACMEIANGQLSSMMKAIGILELDDVWNLEPLMNKPFRAMVKVTIDPDGTYDPKNEISKFLVGGDASTTKTGGKKSKVDAIPDEPWATGGEEKKDKKKKDKKKKKKKE